ncbi:unnamed protein product [Closterium sp. NIES-65]|nr:unnamed protein product [Closterium sp. NIES-65]
MASPPILDWQLDEDRFVALLEKLINEARYLQNNPPECVPKEDRAVRHVLDVLQPYSEEEGGPLYIQHVSYVEGRGNLVITYKGLHPSSVLSFVGCHMDVVTANPDDWVPPSPSNLLSFVGCHMDIVTANPDDWAPPSPLTSSPSSAVTWTSSLPTLMTGTSTVDPFTFSRDGDKLRGRGTTDCLGHAALVTELMRCPLPLTFSLPPTPRPSPLLHQDFDPFHLLRQIESQGRNGRTAWATSFPPLTFSHLVRPLPSPLLYQDFDPFTFSRDGDKLRGRGTTDCLGHVALVTELMRQLAVCRPELGATVVAVLIANEENATVKDIGVDGLVKAGLLDHLRNGPLFWVDTADKQPCIGTGGMLAWKLKAFGKLFHSGLPHKVKWFVLGSHRSESRAQPSPQRALFSAMSRAQGVWEALPLGPATQGALSSALMGSASQGAVITVTKCHKLAMTALAEMQTRSYHLLLCRLHFSHSSSKPLHSNLTPVNPFTPPSLFQAVNPIELAMTALAEIQTRFYHQPPSPQLHPSALLCTFSLPGGEPYRAGHDSTGGDTGPLLPGLPSACHGEDVWAVNPIELGMTALAEIQTRFYRDFPPHEMEKTYGFATPSTMKPTQWSCESGRQCESDPWGVHTCRGLQVVSLATALSLPSLCSVDEAAATRSQHMAGIGTKLYPMRSCATWAHQLTPHFTSPHALPPPTTAVWTSVDEVAAKLREYVADINANLSTLSGPGPCSKFVLPEENLQGRLELEIAEAPMKGVACNLDSPGYHALVTATKDVMGECKPYSITGSLPLIRDLQEAGFDVQTMGYGVMATYHARNEYALLSDFKLGYRVLTNLIHRLS